MCTDIQFIFPILSKITKNGTLSFHNINEVFGKERNSERQWFE